MLTHQVYLDTLRTVHFSSQEWKTTLAGLLVLRLIDTYLGESDEGFPSEDWQGIHAVQEALEGLAERDPVLPTLRELTQIVAQSPVVHVYSIAPPMLQYGWKLHNINQSHLAIDVFASLLSHALTSQDHSIAAYTAWRLAVVLRHTGQLDAADHAYAVALHHVQEDKDPELYFRIRMGVTNTLAIRGQCDEADKMLDPIILELRERGLSELEGNAIHGKAFIAGQRFDFLSSLKFCQAALPLISVASEKEILLSQLGAGFVGTDNHQAAEEVLQRLVDQTNDELVRQRCLINLLEVAAKDSDRSNFERYRAEIQHLRLLPDIEAHYRLYLGKGYYNLGNSAAAREAWEHARTLAEISGISHIAHTVDADIAAVTKRKYPVATVTQRPRIRYVRE